MSNLPEVKIGVVAVSRDCFPESLSVNRRKALMKALQLGENLFVSSDDKTEISVYLRDFYKELAFTRQDTMKLYEA